MSAVANPVIEALASDRRIVYKVGAERYHYAPGGTPVGIGKAMGKVRFRDGDFVVLLGASVLRIVP